MIHLTIRRAWRRGIRRPVWPCAVIGTLLLLASAAFSPLAAADGRVETLRLEAAGVTRLVIDAGAGELVVRATPGATAIEVTARIAPADTESDRYELWLRGEDERASLTARHLDRGWFSWGEDDRVIDLEVTLPPHLAVQIEDGAGDLEVSGLRGGVRIEDGSGAIEARDLSGPLRIEDGSGTITVRGVAGPVRVDDGSGSLSVFDVTGDLEIEDGSGRIDVVRAGGAVVIQDGSGSIDVRGAASLEVVESGSGEVTYRDVAGEVTIGD